MQNPSAVPQARPKPGTSETAAGEETSPFTDGPSADRCEQTATSAGKQSAAAPASNRESTEGPCSGPVDSSLAGQLTDSEPQTVRPVVDASHFWLKHSDQLVVGVVLIALLVLMFVHWARLSGWGMRSLEIERLPSQSYEYKVNINEAGWVEWAQLEGIGEILAERIVSDRRQNGPFGSIDDLQRVKGIGPKKLQRIRRWLTVGEERETTPSAD